MDGYLVLASAVVGFLVGLTGAGGGALMTPMLIFLFGVTPSAAISSDLVAALVMRPVGGAVHLRRGTVNLPMVGWLTLGSAPAAFCGALLLRAIGTGKAAETEVEMVLGAALLLGTAAMVVRALVGQRSSRSGPVGAGAGAEVPAGDPAVAGPAAEAAPQMAAGARAREATRSAARVVVRPLPTVAVGVVGGLLVGLTSVGSGSLMIVLLLFLYPALRASELVGTDLVQAIPLTAAAALGQLLFGHVELAVTASVIVGSVPAVFAGSLLSSRAPDRILRPFIALVLLVSGLKYVGVGTTGLAWAAGGAVVALGAWLLLRRRVSLTRNPYFSQTASGIGRVSRPAAAPAEGGEGV